MSDDDETPKSLTPQEVEKAHENFTPEEVKEAFASPARQGKIIKTKRIRNGQPVFVDREFATAEEIADQAAEQKRDFH